jgi:hypothetical protein
VTNPTVIAVLNHGMTTTRPSMTTAKRKPITRDPLMFTTSVPQGNDPPFREETNPSSP